MDEGKEQINREYSLSSGDIVADAMMAAQGAFMRPALEDPLKRSSVQSPHEVVVEMQRMLVAQTAGTCIEGATYVLYFLSQKYPEYFDRMAVVTTWDNVRKPAGRLKDRLHLDQFYFLVKDKHGNWFAGNPANYEPTQENSLSRVLRANNPQDIMDAIQHIEGGEWPNGLFIEQAFASEEYQRPFVGVGRRNSKKVLNTFVIRNEYGNNVSSFEQMPLLPSGISSLDKKS